MSYHSLPLLTAGTGNAYMISLFGNAIENEFDADSGINVAFRVTWDIGHTALQFPPFLTTLHDPGTFFFGVDVSVEVLYAEGLRYIDCYKPGESTRIAPGDSATVAAMLAPQDFTILVCPLARRANWNEQGPLTATVPLPGNMPPLTCSYRALAATRKPSLYVTHASTLRAGDVIRPSLAAGVGSYSTPGQLVSVTEGLTLMASADANPAQIRWHYGAQ